MVASDCLHEQVSRSVDDATHVRDIADLVSKRRSHINIGDAEDVEVYNNRVASASVLIERQVTRVGSNTHHRRRARRIVG